MLGPYTHQRHRTQHIGASCTPLTPYTSQPTAEETVVAAFTELTHHLWAADESGTSPVTRSQFGQLYKALIAKNPFFSAAFFNGGMIGEFWCCVTLSGAWSSITGQPPSTACYRPPSGTPIRAHNSDPTFA